MQCDKGCGEAVVKLWLKSKMWCFFWKGLNLKVVARFPSLTFSILRSCNRGEVRVYTTNVVKTGAFTKLLLCSWKSSPNAAPLSHFCAWPLAPMP